ncbi:transglutaminase-like domain-containing protein [Glycomyces artemisiae]|uniref:Transglutaminase superfamily protein n=1 Tax=Glycomyces artemisiae TaxID=1076443 RepID=A0A2T0USP8_9ACTN|nr:transglutaminase domain-containing protein [Glycomyces artemisiae]PRY60951.1 transglutaminase superfamily protein [Glycomyces artemisiae]
MNDDLAYYAEPGPLTKGAKELPSDIRELLAAVQDRLVHEPGHPDHPTGHLRRAEEILAHPDRPLLGSCRHFTLLVVVALRAHGIPARARCGFATYFVPGWHIDHWVAEYWHDGAWRLADAQLHPSLIADLGIDFDPVDVPRTGFHVAGTTWLQYRSGDLDPHRCGIEGPDTHGPWWIASNLIRDTAALSKLELLPWDVWGAMPGPTDPITEDLTTLLDNLATLTTNPETAADSRTLYPTESVKVPEKVFNFLRGSTELVDLDA